MDDPSIIEYYGAQVNQSCGYCHENGASHFHSMWAHFLNVFDYQDLLDRGWRRSGKYLYKPSMATTCCPCYTIRCDARTFKLTKSNKKVIRRVNSILLVGSAVNTKAGAPKAAAGGSGADVGCADPMAGHAERGVEHMELGVLASPSAEAMPSQPETVAAVETVDVVETVGPADKADAAENADAAETADATETAESSPDAAQTAESSPDAAAQPEPSPSAAATTTTVVADKPRQKKAKLMRLERRAAKLALNPATKIPAKKPAKNAQKSLEEYIHEGENPNCKYTMRLELLTAKESLARNSVAMLQLYRKYQMRVHGDHLSKLSAKSFERFLVASPFEITHVEDGPHIGYGTFHQLYYMDNILVAVGVLDVLPRCLSAVYFFYDPDLRCMSLGTYSSFIEMQLCQELHAQYPAITSYYMGFYIHSCVKMRYKAHMQPSELLCPEAYTWHRLDEEIIAKLDANKYQRLDWMAEACDGNAFDPEHDVEDVRLLTGQALVTYGQLRKQKPESMQRAWEVASGTQATIKEFGELVGWALSKRLVYMLG